MPFPSFKQAKFKRLQKPRFVRLWYQQAHPCMLGAYLNKLDFWVEDGNGTLSKGSTLSTAHLNITCKQQQSGKNRNDFREDLLKPFTVHLTSVLVKLCWESGEGLGLEAREMAQWATCLPHKC